jgi:hypothetical protein
MVGPMQVRAERTRTLDDLPLLPGGLTVGQFSSHNKTGSNGDAGWFLYRDAHGDAVIFDVTGPGCVKSMWGTSLPEKQKLKFYFDGEEMPRFTVNASELYSGEHPLFPSPLSSFRVTGRYDGMQSSGNCFVPIPFRESLKIAVEGEVTFHHLLYERYPYGTEVETFTGSGDHAYLLEAFACQGEELLPDATAEVVTVEAGEIPPGGALDLLSVQTAGVIRRIVLDAEGSEEFLRDAEIEMRWEGSDVPDVIAPVGMFFACPMKAEEVRALPLKVEKLGDGRLRLTTYFRMPFWRGAHVRLVNRMAHGTGPVRAETHIAPQAYPEGTAGHFCTQYRSGRTVMGRDWPFFEADGTGWFVGAVQTMLGGHYCEGDEHFALDGAGMPQINGTGTEDYYLACFWPNVNFNLPFAGCVGDVFAEGGGHFAASYRRTGCYYRFHLEAPIPFYSRVDARIQHGGASDILSRYASLGFAYLRKRPALAQTDFIDVGNPESERVHGYAAPRSAPTGDLESRYEGGSGRATLRDHGWRHEGGEIRFTVAIRPENGGVRLRRRLDQASPRQSAGVYVDGRFAGIWDHPDENPHLRWFDSDFDLHPDLTRGRERLEMLLDVTSGGGHGAFTDFRYEAFVFEPCA